MLQRLEKELQNAYSPLKQYGGSCGGEVEAIASGCPEELIVLDRILGKHQVLGEKQGGFRKLRYQVLFDNARMADLPSLRSKMTYYTRLTWTIRAITARDRLTIVDTFHEQTQHKTNETDSSTKT